MSNRKPESFFSSFETYNYSEMSCLTVDRSIFDMPKTFSKFVENIDVYKKYITKPQELLFDNQSYYIAKDVYTNTIYMCFRDLLIIDLDIHKVQGDITLNLSDFNNIPEHVFDVYKSKNGYHVFCVSHKYPFGTEDSFQLMIKYQCDYYYACYSYLRGYCVRLNKKMQEYISKNRTSTYSFVGRFGKGAIDKNLVYLVDLHKQYSLQYENHTPCKQ